MIQRRRNVFSRRFPFFSSYTLQLYIKRAKLFFLHESNFFFYNIYTYTKYMYNPKHESCWTSVNKANHLPYNHVFENVEKRKFLEAGYEKE